jgi:hypothetical protein
MSGFFHKVPPIQRIPDKQHRVNPPKRRRASKSRRDTFGTDAMSVGVFPVASSGLVFLLLAF